MRDLVGGTLIFLITLVPISLLYASFTSGQRFLDLSAGAQTGWHFLFAFLTAYWLILCVLVWQYVDELLSQR